MVVLLVTTLDAHKDGDGLVGGGLVHVDRLEPALQSGIPLDVLAVVVQGCSAYALELASGQRRLQDVGRVYRSLGGAGAHHGVHLVDEQHAVARVPDLVDDLLEPLFELTAVLGASYQSPHIQGDQPLPLKGLGYLATDDALGQGLDDGSLAHPWLADEHRVVLGAAAEDLDHPLDLFAPADHRVQLVGAGRLGQVDAQLVQRGGASLTPAAMASGGRRLAEDAMGFRPHLVQGHAQALQYPGGDSFSLSQQADEEVLGADIGMVHAAGLVHRQLDHFLRPGGQADLALRRFLAPSNDEFNGGTDLVEVYTKVSQHSGSHALGLSHQPQKDMLGANIVMVKALGLFLGEGEDFPGSLGELLESTSHRGAPPSGFLWEVSTPLVSAAAPGPRDCRGVWANPLCLP